MASGADGGGGSYRAGRVVGDYVFDRQIGLGSFSVVWRARHRTQGTEVAVKEIVMERLSRKLQESLLSEVVILKKISHPNIIALHDIVEASGRIYLILEYCRGGDLSKFIQRHGRVPEATAKCFMQQLASGLQVLRENNLIHRDLKPQNLLLSTHDDNSVLKIADFGFARSLHPRGLAETLCGSPLYMAPEIMQLQKYDAKADLWSVGAILFQLVTGKTPFTGSNQIQLLQNIMKSNELRFPSDNSSSWDCIDLCRKLLRCNPVERLTFEEFFNHPFLSQHRADESLSKTSTDMRDGFSSVECSATRFSGGSSQEDRLPILLDDESSEKNACPPMLAARSIARPIYGFSLDNKINENLANSPSKSIGTVPRFSRPPKKLENTSFGRDYYMPTGTNVKEPADSTKGSTVADSLEFIDQEYVIVPGPPLEMSTSSLNSFGPDNPPSRSDDLLVAYQSSSPSNVPVQINGTVISERHAIGSLYNSRYPASETSQGSMGTVDSSEEPPSIHCIARIRSVEQFSFIITELVKEEMASGRRLEAFSLQLVNLAIWKLALHTCHAQAVPSSDECNGSSETPLSDGLCSQTERDFLIEVERAEELARDVGQVDDATEMPDPIEIIFQSALTFGRHGAVDDMMGHTERAMAQYGKSMCLLYFLLAEASSLVPNPPVSLTKSDRYRLRSYIIMISSRYGQLEATKNGASEV